MPKITDAEGKEVYVGASVPGVVAPCVTCGRECWSGEGDPEEVKRSLCMCADCAKREFQQ